MNSRKILFLSMFFILCKVGFTKPHESSLNKDRVVRRAQRYGRYGGRRGNKYEVIVIDPSHQGGGGYNHAPNNYNSNSNSQAQSQATNININVPPGYAVGGVNGGLANGQSNANNFNNGGFGGNSNAQAQSQAQNVNINIVPTGGHPNNGYNQGYNQGGFNNGYNQGGFNNGFSGANSFAGANSFNAGFNPFYNPIQHYVGNVVNAAFSQAAANAASFGFGR
uniref:CSON004361 protein n=1 Tax=Culicoides sonorensis TaxID=179676 RepID=A0A336LTI6_CULSO